MAAIVACGVVVALYRAVRGCAATGAYMLESAIFAATGGVCRCGFDDPPPPGEEMPPGPGLSVSFSKGAVIYEDSYENSPGVWMPKRSTRVRLSIAASGGPHGGTLSLSSSDLGKLSPVACGPLYLPSSVQIAAGDGYRVSFLCEAAEQSMIEDDVKVTGVFTENNTGESFTNVAELTVVQVGLQTVRSYVRPYTRRVYGIHEEVACNSIPALPITAWNCSGGTFSNDYNHVTLTCGWHAYSGNVVVGYAGTELKLPIEVMEPVDIRCLGSEIEPMTVPIGVAGGIGMLMNLYVFPTNVSFYNIAVMEVPTYNGFHSGYFDDLRFEAAWDHTPSNHAGVWYNIDSENKWLCQDTASFYAFDTYGNVAAPPPWSDGLIVWNIPIAWGERDGNSGDNPIGVMGTVYNQTFMIHENGTVNVVKFGNSASRSTNGVVRLNGVIVQ